MCVGRKNQPKAEDEFLAREDARAHNCEDARDADIKQEPGDEKATRGLCLSVAARPAESIPMFLKERIEHSVSNI